MVNASFLPVKFIRHPTYDWYPLGRLIELMDEGFLLLDEECRHWQEHEEQYFLDYVLKGFPVPEITFNGWITAGHICEDGRNRLWTLHKFVKGELLYKTNDGVEHDFTKQSEKEQQNFLNSVMITVRKLDAPEWHHDCVAYYLHNLYVSEN